MCVLKSLRAYKSLDVYNYTPCWIEQLFSLGILNTFHPSLLHFAHFTAQQLFIISSHQLSLQYCLFAATCLLTHLKMAITEVLMIRRAKVVISFSLFFSQFLFSLPPLVVISLHILQSVMISSAVISAKFFPSSHIFLSCMGNSNSTFCINMNVHYVALP